MEVIEVPPYVSDEEEDMNASVQVERKKQAKKKRGCEGEGYCKPSPAAKNIKIGEKRRRGRPSKAKKALLIQ